MTAPRLHLQSPDIAGSTIEHLDFAPTCEEGSETSDPCGNPAAFRMILEWCCVAVEADDDLLICSECLQDELTDYDEVECDECGHTWPSSPASIKRIEPLR